MQKTENESLVTNMNAQIDLLASMSAQFANSLNIKETLNQALSEIICYLDAEGGAVFLKDEKSDQIKCVTCVGATEITGLTLNLGQGIVGKSIAENKGIIVRDVKNDPDFYQAVDHQTGFITQSILCAPLSVKDKCVGAIELVNRKDPSKLFEHNDLKVLETLSSSAALALINARMAKELVEQERVKREVELAADIQKRFLPSNLKTDERAPAIWGINIAARGVSGDFYDFFTLPDGRLYFALGDVSGKGMNAALLMAKTASLFRSLGKNIHNPGVLLGRINSELCETAAYGMFVTMVCGIYSPHDNLGSTISVANAGHEPILLQNGTSFQSFSADGPPLGILETYSETNPYEEIILHPKNGRLFIYTDGLTEGYDETNQPLGVEAIEDFLCAHLDCPLDQCVEQLSDLVLETERNLRDDVTILAIEDCLPPLSLQQDAPVETCLLELKVKAKPQWLKHIRTCIHEACHELEIDQALCADIILAVDEACQNIIRHAYGEVCNGVIELTLSHQTGKLIITLRDYAPSIDLRLIKPRHLADIRPGGLGTHLIQEIMDDVKYLHPLQGDGNLLRLEKYFEKG